MSKNKANNSATNAAKREAKMLRNEAKDTIRVLRMDVQRGAARAKRRAGGNFNPVNPLASLAQHPYAKFGRNNTLAEVQAKLAKAA